MSDIEQVPASEEPPPRKRRARQRRGGGFTLLLALLALGLSGYLAYETLWERFMDPAPAVATAAALQQVSRKLDQRLADMQTQLGEAGRERAAAISEMQESVAEEVLLLREELGASGQDWIFAEVEFLLRMAHQRLLLERDTEAALGLLVTADELVRDARGMVAHDLREALARDMAALRTVSMVDVQGIYLRLAALARQVPELQRNMASGKLTPPPPEVEQEAPRDIASRVTQRLTSLIDFRRNTSEVRPILPPGEDHYLRWNLSLTLQVAQLALLNGEQAVFESSLTDASQWVRDEFDVDHPGTQAMLISLDELSATDIASELPDISDSLEQARLALRKFHQTESRQ